MASTIQQIETPKCARALDTSGNNNHGQIYSGRALEFDGVTDYFQHNGGTGITGTSLFANGVPWTWACWIYFDSASTSENYFVGNDGQTQPHITFKNSSSDNILRFRDTNADYYTFSTTKLDNNTWYRIVITTDGTSITAYVNGVVYGTIAANQANVAADDNFDNTLMEFSGWGCPYSSGGTRAQHLQGMMSDGQVWDATWTASDVSYDYLNPESLVLSNGGTSLAESNLKIWYPMQDGHRGQQSYILDASNAGLGDELVTNGTFDSDISSWTDYASSYTTETYDNGGLKIVASGGTARMTQEVTGLKSGTTYKFSFDVVSRTGNNFAHLGTAAGGSQIASNLGYATAGTHTHFFTSTQTTVHIQLGTVDGTTVVYDNVSLKPVNDKNNATTVFYGDEFITNDPADNRTFDNDAGNWAASNSTVAWNGSYGASGGGLRVTPNGSGGSEGAKLTSGNWGSSIVLGRSYFISMDIKGHTGELDDFRFKFGNENSSTFSVTTSFATYTATVTPSTTTNSFFVEKTSNTDTNPFYIDNISVKEAGVASGWTDADQQLHIPQTALQSYNELAWFDGYADYVQLSDPYNHNLITVSAWVYVGWETSAHKCWFANRDTSEDGLLLTVSASEKLFAKFNGTTLTSSASIPTGEWTHVVYTYDDATMKLYINGEQDSNTTSFTTSDIAVTTNARIGVDSQAGKLYDFPGSITELSIWAAVLTQAEVNELYNDGKALNATIHSKAVTASTNLKGYFRNNGLSTWTDLSDDYSNNGTPSSLTETMLIPSGVDGSRDSQGFIMNRQRNTSSLNFPVNNDTADHTGPGMEARYTKDGVVDSQFGNGLGDFTVEFWFKTNQILSSSGSVLYQSAGYSAPNWSGIDIHLNNAGNVRASMYTGSSSTSVIWGDSGGSGVDYNDGNWHHVVFVVDRSTSATLIIDKVVKNIVTGTTITDHTSVVCFSGSQRVGSSTSAFQTGATTNRPAFDGQIDGLRIYNDLLTFDTDGSIAEGETVTSGEVLQNYNATKGSHRN